VQKESIVFGVTETEKLCTVSAATSITTEPVKPVVKLPPSNRFAAPLFTKTVAWLAARSGYDIGAEAAVCARKITQSDPTSPTERTTTFIVPSLFQAFTSKERAYQVLSTSDTGKYLCYKGF
jgi:hypothetical protein